MSWDPAKDIFRTHIEYQLGVTLNWSFTAHGDRVVSVTTRHTYQRFEEDGITGIPEWVVALDGALSLLVQERALRMTDLAMPPAPVMLCPGCPHKDTLPTR